MINTPDKPREHHAPAADKPMIFQVIFVVMALAVITGGLWSLYMSDAPYHPQEVKAEDVIFLASD